MIVGEGNNYKEVEGRVRTLCEDVVKEFNKYGEASFELEK